MSAMQMSQVLSQRMEQKLVMTRQMIQSIEMLQLPLLALQQNVNQELTANPWLEIMEAEAVESTPEQIDKREEAEGDGEKKGDGGGEEEELFEFPERPRADEFEPDAQKPREEKGEESDARIHRLETLMKEWNEGVTRSGTGDFVRRNAGEEDAVLNAVRNTAAPTDSLQEHLLRQLHLVKEEPRLKELAEVIIGSLDKNGYLKTEPLELFSSTDGGVVHNIVEGEVTAEEAELALTLVQNFEPPGVGARSLQECLLLQMARIPEDTSFEEKLVRDHLDDLSQNRLPKVAKETGVDVAQVKEGLKRIARLNPKPGGGFAAGRPQYVVPDVIVEEVDGAWEVNVNESYLPPLRVSRDSLDLLRREGEDEAVHNYIMGKLGAAVWLMEAVVQRRNTLRRIAEQIVKAQNSFFENGPSHLKPLMMQDIADRINMHISTVSRAINGKYMQTPQGLFPMKYFFSGGFSTGDGEAESNRTVMMKIAALIKNEDKKKPLSDKDVEKILLRDGITIARRTVAKYREKLNIPSSRQRKEY